jgi:hypothetical protein
VPEYRPPRCDLEAPWLPEKEYDAVAKRRSNEPTIMETIASVSKALQEYQHASGFSPAAAKDTEDVDLSAPRLTWSQQKTRPRRRM